MLAFDDFITGNCFSFEAEIAIWKKEADLFINLLDNNENDLHSFLSSIQQEIDWIKNNKNKIEDVLLEENILEMVENITSSAYFLKCADEECYMLDDGFKVYFPITKDDFLDSLYVESISIDFDKYSNTSIELILMCDPDYFIGKFLLIEIDRNKNIKFQGLKDD